MFFRLLSSYTLTYLTLIMIAISCAVATFIENDFGVKAARALIYEAHWFEVLLAVNSINLIALIYTTKMYKNLVKFLIHISIVLIFIASFFTRYFGYEGTLFITEKSYTNVSISSKNYLQVWLSNEQEKQHIIIPYEMHPFASKVEKEIVIGEQKINLIVDKKDFKKERFKTSGKILLHVKVGNASDDFEMDFVENQIGKSFSKLLDGVNVQVQYGSREIKMPFEVTLDDFILKKYPGTKYPSEYLSHITINETNQNKSFKTVISMNEPLSYDGYKFFQTSYSPDEKGTILSLNKDPGKIPTYIGYAIFITALLLSFFTKNSKFYTLLQRTKNYTLTLILLFSMFATPTFAENSYQNEYIKEHQEKSKELSKAFGMLTVQAMGRMQPLATLSRDILYKFSKKSSLYGMDANQILLGMLSKADIWKNIPLFSIKTNTLKKLLNKEDIVKFISYNDLFNEHGRYLLIEPLNQAAQLKPSEQSTFHKEVIRMNERVEISHMVYGAKVFSIFPDTKNGTNNWRDFQTLWQDSDEYLSEQIQEETIKFLDATYNRDYDKALTHLKSVDKFQKEHGKELILKQEKLLFEIEFNKLEIFNKLTFLSLFIGIFCLIVAFSAIFFKFFTKKLFLRFFTIAVGILFILHFLALVGRWYISGHAPMSDTYESMLYISFSSLFFSVFFFRKSLFTLGASVLLYSMFMLGAFLSHIDPQVTTLVPVLKSFWLTLHVSVIAGSYGFLGVGAMIGLLCLFLYTLRWFKNKDLEPHINYLSDINEITIYIGLVLLLIGNLLGAIWANESWGRYWGWDPKETWTFISIVLYTSLTHIKYLKIENYKYWYAVFSLGSFSTILMTYFGVNYYLAGKHSYATGDPVPIPIWVYIALGVFVLFVVISFSKRKI